MSRAPYPDILHLWDVTWTKEGKVWVGPAITDPKDPMLATAVACERIIRQDGRYVLVDAGLTLDRFGWSDGELRDVTPEDAEDEAP
jgi:hypothetical protein